MSSLSRLISAQFEQSQAVQKNYTVSLIRMFIAFSGHHHGTVESEQRTLHLTVNSLTRECVNNGTSKVHRNFLRNNGERNKEKKQYDFYSFHYFAYSMDLRLQRLCKPRTEERVLMPRCSQSSQPFDCKTTKNSIKNDSANPGNRSPRVQL